MSTTTPSPASPDPTSSPVPPDPALPPPQPSSSFWRRASSVIAVATAVIAVVLAATGLWRDFYNFTMPGSSTSTTSAAPPVSVSEDPPLYSSGSTVAMGRQWAVRFDAPWTNVHVNDGDITIDEVDVAAQPNVAFARVGASPTYQSCRTAAYTIRSVVLEDLASPTSLCVQRADGRIGVLILCWNNGKKGDSLRVDIKGFIWDARWGTPR